MAADAFGCTSWARGVIFWNHSAFSVRFSSHCEPWSSLAVEEFNFLSSSAIKLRSGSADGLAQDKRT